MDKKKRIIILSVLSILIIICIVLGVTYSFMHANIESNSVTEVSLSSCAHITLDDTDVSIDLENSYPMSRNRALQTTPYTFTLSSSCNESVGFNIYIATLNTNTLDASNIHYIITEHGNIENILSEGKLNEATDGLSDFQDYELSELNNGIKGTYGNIYKIYSNGLHNNAELIYDLYLYIDESVTNDTMGQTFSAGVAVKTFDYNFATINDITIYETASDSIIVSVNATAGDNAIVDYYFAKNEDSYIKSNQYDSYKFTDLDVAAENTLKVYAVDNEGYQSAVFSIEAKTAPTLANICPDGGNLANCIQTYYKTYGEGTNGLYYHDGIGSYTNANLEAGDNSYRYSGINPSNYVCFGSDEATCPKDNLYRIIGIFNDIGEYQIKLIKNTSIGNYAWDSDNINTWDETIKPDIYTILNETYYNSLESNWQNLIAESTWKVGGMPIGMGYGSIDNAFNYELGVNQTGYEETMKIGLMYVTDFGYSTGPLQWSARLSCMNCNSYGQRWLNLYDFTISRTNDISAGVFIAIKDGIFAGDSNDIKSNFFVRPSFYLESSVELNGGSGVVNDPYRIKIN